MIDLEKERKAFIEFKKEEPQNTDGYDAFLAWIYRATQAETEITELKQKLDAKHDAFVYIDECRKEWHESFKNKCNEVEILKQKLASYENPDYVLVPIVPTEKMLDAFDEAFEIDYDDWYFDAEIAYKRLLEAVGNGGQ